MTCTEGSHYQQQVEEEKARARREGLSYEDWLKRRDSEARIAENMAQAKARQDAALQTAQECASVLRQQREVAQPEQACRRSPGFMLSLAMRFENISEDEASQVLLLSRREFQEFLKGDLRLTMRLAERLARFMHTSAEYWIELEDDYLKALKPQVTEGSTR